jgi:hypothetical protein
MEARINQTLTLCTTHSAKHSFMKKKESESILLDLKVSFFSESTLSDLKLGFFS